MNYTISDENLLYSPLLEQMPGWMFIKDRDFKYTSSTLRSSLLCGFKKQQDKLGKSDFELKCKASESAEFFQQEDKKVMNSGQEISFLQLNQYADNQTHIFLTKKIPLKNSYGNIVGVCGIVEEVLNSNLAQKILKLANLGKTGTGNTAHTRNFQIDANDIFNRLSASEAALIFYFIRGLSNKEISLLMKLSPQIIESDLESIKNKFNCHSISDLNHYFLEHDCVNVIPHTILKQYVNETTSLNSSINAADAKQNLLATACSKLSKRQKECLYYLTKGLSTKEIANKLNLSTRTVDSYIEIMKKKFRCRSRYGLIVKLIPFFTE